MSIPVSVCLVIKAATNEDSYQELLRRMAYNMRFGGFTQIPCDCTPKCVKPPESVLARMIERLEQDLAKQPKRPSRKDDTYGK